LAGLRGRIQNFPDSDDNEILLLLVEKQHKWLWQQNSLA